MFHFKATRPESNERDVDNKSKHEQLSSSFRKDTTHLYHLSRRMRAITANIDSASTHDMELARLGKRMKKNELCDPS